MHFRPHLLALLLPLTLAAQTYTFKVIAGGALPVNLPATSVDIGSGYVAAGPSGDVFISLVQYNIVSSIQHRRETIGNREPGPCRRKWLLGLYGRWGSR
jgi:hypothetical protein